MKLRFVSRLFVPIFVGSLFLGLILILLAGSVDKALAFSGGYALAFDGDDDLVTLGAIDTMLGSSWRLSKTLSVWVRPQGAPYTTANPAAAEGNLILGDFPRWFGITRGELAGTDAIWVYNTSNFSGTAQIQVDYTTGEWVHIALVQGANFLSAYKNGVLVATEITTGTGGTDGHELVLSGYLQGGTPRKTFRGQIDEVRVYSRTLTTEEIRADMYRTLAGNEDRLRAYYQMSDGPGAMSLTDDSQFSNTGTINGNPAWVASGAFAGPRNALDFDGTGDYVAISNTLPMPANLTLESWVYPRSLAPGSHWIAGEDGGARLVLNGSTLEFYINDGVDRGPATATVSPDQWQHVAGTFDGATLRVYVNGIEGTGVSFSGANVDLGNNFYLGASGPSGSHQDGILDEIRLWNFARSRSEIVFDMLHTLQGDEPGLVAYYRLDQENAADQDLVYDLPTGAYPGVLSVGMDPNSDWVSSAPFNTWIGSDSTAWSSSGNWSLNGVPTGGANVGLPGYPGSNDPTITSTVSLSNLVVSIGSTLVVSDVGSLTVTDLLTNSGTLQETAAVNGSTEVSFFSGGSGTGAYGGMTINANGLDLGSTTVTIDGQQDCTNNPNEAVQRCFDINPTNNTARDATITFYFSDFEIPGSNTCSTLEAYHWGGASWGSPLALDTAYGTGGRDCATVPRSLRVQNVTTFSPFVLASSGPTAVALRSIEANSGVNLTVFTAASLLLGVLILTGLWILTKKAVARRI